MLARGSFLTFDNQIDATTGTVKAKARFGNGTGRLFPNQFVNVSLLVDTLSIEGGLIGAGFDEFRWPRPTRPGDTLRLDVEVLGVKTSQSKPRQGFLNHRVTTYNQHDEPVLIMTGNLLVPRRQQG